MSNAFIQVPAQSVGLKVQTFENTVSANVVEAEAVVLVRSSDNTEIGTAAQPVTVVDPKVSQTPSAPTAVTVGAANGAAVVTNASRTGLVLVNTSVNTISLGFGAAAVLNSGITLNPSGGTFVMDKFTFYTGAINAIASAASSNLAVQEFA